MKYQKITNMLDNKPNHPYKFMSKKWVEINVERIKPIGKLSLRLQH